MNQETVEVVVGRIGRPHGIAGLMTVEVRTDEPDVRFAPGAVLTTEPVVSGRPTLTIASARYHSGRMLIGVDGIVDRTGAESLRGLLLIARVAPFDLPEEPGEYYDRQLVGLSVVTVDGLAVGTIHEVVHLPSQDLLAVRRDGRPDVLVPFVEVMVPTVDLAAGVVTIDPPEGLLDLDLDGASPDDSEAEADLAPDGESGSESEVVATNERSADGSVAESVE